MIQNVIVSANPTSVVAQQANSDGPLIELFIRRKRSHAIQRTHQIAVDQFMQFMNYKSLATVSLVDMVEYTEHLEAAYKTQIPQLKIDEITIMDFGSE